MAAAAQVHDETKETFDVERIHTWFRNHKCKKKGGDYVTEM